MLYTVLMRKISPIISSSAMASRGAPIQYLSESTTIQQHQPSIKKQKTEQTVENKIVKTVSPIGYIKSCFKSKNGTPRQPSVCTFSRAKLDILKSVFQCPDHSLQGLEQFSHVWIMFLFHKNGQDTFTKAKVKPPRLNGAKVGLFATRSPHRPNPIGLTLAKLDQVKGGTLYLSGVDIIEGTPVLDIKPYVPTYDNPANVLNGDKNTQRSVTESGDVTEDATGNLLATSDKDRTVMLSEQCMPASVALDSSTVEKHSPQTRSSLEENDLMDVSPNSKHQSELHHCKGDSQHNSQDMSSSPAREDRTQTDSTEHKASTTGDHSDRISATGDLSDRISEPEVKVADWIQSPPITKLQVEFTPKAERQLSAFQPQTNEGSSTSTGDCVLEFFKNAQEAKQAICEILEADPRSTYRRTSCSDRLYFFAVDTIHVTCWFYDGIAEVIRIQPFNQAKLKS